MKDNYDNKQQPLNFNINIPGDNNTGISSSMQNSNNNNQQYSSSPQRDSIDFTNFLQHAANPGIVLFTLLFKTLAVVSFLILGIFGVSDALIFIIVVILNAFDFWFVKNVSGRILVGLRWWNEVKDDGTEVWIFESDHEKRATSIDTTLFWTSLYITPCFWGVFLVIELIGLSLMWFLVCLISFVLTFSNTVGYYKCSGEQKKKISNFLAEKGQKGFTTFLKFGANALSNNQQNNNK
jgi:hypothetical protein